MPPHADARLTDKQTIVSPTSFHVGRIIQQSWRNQRTRRKEQRKTRNDAALPVDSNQSSCQFGSPACGVRSQPAEIASCPNVGGALCPGHQRGGRRWEKGGTCGGPACDVRNPPEAERKNKPGKDPVQWGRSARPRTQKIGFRQTVSQQCVRA